MCISNGADVLNFGTEDVVSDCDFFYLYSVLSESASQDTVQYRDTMQGVHTQSQRHLASNGMGKK